MTRPVQQASSRAIPKPLHGLLSRDARIVPETIVEEIVGQPRRVSRGESPPVIQTDRASRSDINPLVQAMYRQSWADVVEPISTNLASV